MDLMEVTVAHHMALVLAALWAAASAGWTHPAIYLFAFLYFFAVNERYTMRQRRRAQYEERKCANQRRILSDAESVRWLNHAVEKVWPICMERIASQQFLLPIIPWFLEKFKPWTARKAVIQNLYLGRNPPMFTDIRVVSQSTGDDHLVLEIGMNFLSADDMNAKLAVQLRKRVGFGMTATMHVTGMHVEGKILVGVRFVRHWPFLGRVRVCFVEPPYFQMTVKPIFGHGLDVSELPGISGWLDRLLDVAFGQTLVENANARLETLEWKNSQRFLAAYGSLRNDHVACKQPLDSYWQHVETFDNPNMLVIDLEKFVSTPTESWFSVDEKPPIGHAKVEILEGVDMKPSDFNGLSDPYVKGHLGPYHFQTKIHKKTLSPKWLEEFKIPITSWESPNVLVLQVWDKDPIFDDTLGSVGDVDNLACLSCSDCSISLNDLRGGQRHDVWMALKNTKMGRIHMAVTIIEGELEKLMQDSNNDDQQRPGVSSMNKDSYESSDPIQKMCDEYERIDIEGLKKADVWVHHPGSEAPHTWVPRKRRTRHLEPKILQDGNRRTDSPRSSMSVSQQSDSSSDELVGGKSRRHLGKVKRGLGKLAGAMFHVSPKKNSAEEGFAGSTPHVNLQPVGESRISVKFVVDEDLSDNLKESRADSKPSSPAGGELNCPSKREPRGKAKEMSKHAGRTAHNVKCMFSKKGLDKSKRECKHDDIDDRDAAEVDSPVLGSPTVGVVDARQYAIDDKLLGTMKDSAQSMSSTSDILPNTR